ncbi:MAG: glycosyl transferase [Bacteroidia bacterium]|nr:glycosyl transferase [Bacteroidia bacterium]
MDSKQKYFAFTLCSNNYLAQANVLKESFLKFNPDFQFYIGLVDELSPVVNYDNFKPAAIVPVKELKAINVNELIAKYDIIEFNTCVKPSFFKYIIQQNKDAEIIYYIDPDICFYDSIQEINEILKTHSMALTPHITSPIKLDEFGAYEPLFLNYGIYNLGFLGINAKSKNALAMLDWWEERTLTIGYNRTSEGLFVDQLWMNLAPMYYNDVAVLKSYKFNMAPWNLHERSVVEIKNEEVVLNDNSKLVFYHFSNLSTDKNEISRFYTRYDFNKFPLLKKLYEPYFEKIEAQGYSKLKTVPISYALYKKEKERTSAAKSIVLKMIGFLEKVSRKV